MFYAALLLKILQIPLFLDVGSKNTVNYSVFGHLTFKNIAICSGFCLPEYKNRVKNGIFVVVFHVFVVVVVVIVIVIVIVVVVVVVAVVVVDLVLVLVLVRVVVVVLLVVVAVILAALI